MSSVSVRAFFESLNGEAKLSQGQINAAIANCGANGIVTRDQLKSIDSDMFGILGIPGELHQPISAYFQAGVSAASAMVAGAPGGAPVAPDIIDPFAAIFSDAAAEASAPPCGAAPSAPASGGAAGGSSGSVKRPSEKTVVTIEAAGSASACDKKRRSDRCVICEKVPDMPVSLTCSHTACASCLHDRVVQATRELKNLHVRCATCNAEVPHSDLRQVLYPHEYEAYNTALLKAMISSDDTMIKCIKCEATISLIPQDGLRAPAEIKIKDDMGKPISPESWVHYKQWRIRCRTCGVVFCGKCKLSPYHLGFTCAGHKAYLTSRKCRFCAASLKASNSVVLPPETQITGWNVSKLTGFLQTHGMSYRELKTIREKPLLVSMATKYHTLYRNCCTSEECSKKRDLACPEILPCGCPCGGVRGEHQHLVCMKCDPKLDPDEFCPICFVEGLGDAPCVQSTGECKHIFHLQCLRDRIKAGYNGARINFKFLMCSLCNRLIQHPMLARELAPWMALKKEIESKAVAKLKYEGRMNDPKIKRSYGGDVVAFAMHEFLFYMCYKCKKPYFAGNYSCQEADDGKFDPKELLCGGCQPATDVQNCPKHGTEWIAFKCRFCCNTAQWYCWNKTHFCGKCHKPKVWQTLVTYRTGANKKKIWEYPQCPGLKAAVDRVRRDSKLNDKQKEAAFKKLRSDPATCPLKRRHPPNGFEFGLGCTMCADRYMEADRKAVERRNAAEAAGSRV